MSSQLADSPTIQNNVDLSELNFSAVFEKTAEVAHNHQQGENWKIEPPVDASSDVKAAFDTIACPLTTTVSITRYFIIS